jgi:CheY-like chemotaxis protein
MADSAMNEENKSSALSKESQEFSVTETLDGPERLSPFNEVSELSKDARDRLKESPGTPPGGARKPGILIVDDEEYVRAILQTWLRQQGFAVWLAADGQEALELYSRHREAIDVILLDVRMPRLDGPETLAAIQQLNPRVRCCFMSGDLGRYTESSLCTAGAAAVIRKPFQLAEVGRLVRELATNAERNVFSI